MCRLVTLPGSVRPATSLGPPTAAQACLKKQISGGGALQARSPDPAQPSSLREPGAQDPAGPQAFPLNWRESFVANTSQVNSQLPAIALLGEQPNHSGGPAVMMCKVLAAEP